MKEEFASETFKKLKKGKQNRIIKAALNEFIEHGYSNASTNRIVKKARISKGSLFKYFENKEKLFYYLLDMVIEQVIEEFKKYTLSPDLFERIDSIIDIGFNFYEKHPDLYRFMINIANKDEQQMFQKVLTRFNADEKYTFGLMNDFYSDVDASNFRLPLDEFLPVLYWIISGFKLSIHSRLSDSELDIKNLRKVYKERFKTLMDILKYGIFESKEDKK